MSSEGEDNIDINFSLKLVKEACETLELLQRTFRESSLFMAEH
jgi:hypothetical protein